MSEDKYSFGYAICNSIQENKDKIEKLEKQNNRLKIKNKKIKEINEEHKKLNGELREENKKYKEVIDKIRNAIDGDIDGFGTINEHGECNGILELLEIYKDILKEVE